jgi:enoyl-CoA hydratase/carnithine racemase
MGAQTALQGVPFLSRATARWQRCVDEGIAIDAVIVAQRELKEVVGIVPGDGIHSLWPEVIGSIRGRTFVLTQQLIGAEEAKTLGVISEIVTRGGPHR